MADFLDSEAEESEQEDEEVEPHERKKLKKLKAASDSEEEEEDDDDRLREELKDLIDDNPIEDESDAESDASGGSRKRKKSDEEDELSDRLEDDDYDLIEENLGVKIDKNKHRYKRLRRIQDEDSDQETEDETLRREVIAENLFATGSDDEEERRSDRARSQQATHERTDDVDNFDEELSDESDADDFIVDDDGVPITEKRKKRRPIFQDANLQEGQDIFGVDFDYEEFEKYDEEDDYESEDDYEEEDGVGEKEKEKRVKKVKKKVTKKSIFDIYEPSELKRGHFTDLDNEIRKTDVPERMQLREVPVTPVTPEGSNELDEEAEWIYKQAFCKSAVSDQDPPGTKATAKAAAAASTSATDDWDNAKSAAQTKNSATEEEDWDNPAPAAASASAKTTNGEENWDEENWDEPTAEKTPTPAKSTETSQPVPPGRKPATAIGKIKQALDFMRNQQLEVPFIAFYRKEYVQPELNINDLWKVYKYDARWCLLLARKRSLLALFEKMRVYQTEKIMSDIDAPIPDQVRVIRDEDFDRLKNVQTPEELKDVHNHFLLYYAHEIPAMQEAHKKREKQRIREERRAARRRQLLENASGRLDEDGNEIPLSAAEEAEIAAGDDDDDIDDDVEEQPEDNLKYTRDSGPYAMCRKAGICGIAKKFGLKPEQFAENLRDNYQRHEVEQEPIEPLELAKQYVSPKFSKPEEVLDAAKFMVARQLAREPLLRKCVREIFYERAKILVQPTKRGIKEIDENHSCYAMKYVKQKPVRELVGDQFLKLIIAEQDKLLTITIVEKFEGNTSNNYLEEIKQLYQRDEFSKCVQDWNKLRAECVEVALTKMVIPDLRKELHSILLAEAKEAVMKACCRKLYNWIKVAPYSVTFPEEDEYEWETARGGACRIMGIGYVPDYTQSAFCAIVNVDGEVTDYLRLPHLMKRKNSNRPEEKSLKESDLSAIQNFIRTKKPHVVVIGGESREATMIQQDISECIKALREEDQFPDIQVEVADNELAKIYSNSNKGESDFREYPTVLRQAISVARRLQDPLVEYSQLCTADEEILCLRYHTLQDHLNKEELLENLYLEFINRTNEVGVDINLAVQNPLTVNLVQFICGLGPRKGAALIKILKQTNQRIENRTQLVTACHMGPKVFINCSGFIKIDTNSLGDSTEAYVEVLDGSRVHPETYEWARKMAVDALEYEDEEDANPAGALEEILESPERLKDLDLDAFAVELERQGFGNKSITLYDIRAELNSRYKDLRTPYRSPNSEELFDMLTKETPETFYVGRMVLATVVGISHRKPQGEQLDQANPVRNDESGLWQCPFCMVNDFPELSEVWNHFDAGACPGQATGVKLRLDNGLNGFIHIKNLSDKHVKNPEERVQMGQTIHVRIIKIDVERFSVDCTSKSSDLADKNNEWRPTKDSYYDQEAEDAELRKEEDSKKVKARQQYIKRVIVHPSFHNISYAEAVKIMSKMDQGEVIVRPSSKGSDHLTATWKLYDDVFQHIDIREEGKENAFSLGQSLWIGNEEFEDLDEIIARHINPMAALARDLFNYKYYRDTNGGDRAKAEELLKEEKKKNANKIHYFISVSKQYPGKFMLSYLPRNKFKHEYVTVTPDGFRFRSQMFDSVNALLKWFKEHFKDPLPQTTPSTPRGGGMTSSSRTPYNTTPGTSLVNNDAIKRVAQNMPSHMLHSLSQVASQQTPHYPHTPGYGGQSVYINTPYTPSGQTPYMTPYHTPHTSQTPRYGQSTPQPGHGGFLHPGAPAPSSHRNYASGSGGHHHHHQVSPHSRAGGYTASQESMDWQKASDAWGSRGSNNRTTREGSRTPKEQGRITPKSVGGRTPRYDEMARKTPQYDNRPSSRSSYYGKSPRSHGTPGTTASPMPGGDTPLYDEN